MMNKEATCNLTFSNDFLQNNNEKAKIFNASYQYFSTTGPAVLQENQKIKQPVT